MKFIASKIPPEELKLIDFNPNKLHTELNEKQCYSEFAKFEIPIFERENTEVENMAVKSS
jgi:hypothetical protein